MNVCARWIAPEGVRETKNCHFFAEHEFELTAVPEQLNVRIAAESYYEISVNGVPAGQGPARGTSKINYADCIDIAPLLKAGCNQIKVHVLCMNVSTGCCSPAEPALWVQGGDNGEYFISDRSWKCSLCPREYPSDVPYYSQPVGFSQRQDCRFSGQTEPVQTIELAPDSPVLAKKLLERSIPMPVERKVLPAEILAAAFVPAADLNEKNIARLSTFEKHLPIPGKLEHQLQELLQKGKSVTLDPAPDQGGITIVFNFAQEISGGMELQLTAPAGTVADLAFEEELYQGDRLRADHTHTNPDYQFSDRFILKEGCNRLSSGLYERGFRMLQLTIRNMTAPVIIHGICGVDRRYPLTAAGDFFCSDYRMNHLWQCARKTLSACTTDIFTDCPWRERTFFTNDLVVENRIALELFFAPELHKHALEMMLSEAREDGMIYSFCPAHDLLCCGINLAVILSANLTLPLVLRDYWMRTNDTQTVKMYYPALEKLLESFRSRLSPEGLIDPPECWNFFDWSYEMNGSAFSCTRTSLLNYLYVMALRAMEKLAPAAGHCYPGCSDADRILKATTAAFYDPAAKRIADAQKSDIPAELLERLGVPPGGKRESRFSRLPHALAILAGEDPALAIEGLLDESLLTPDLFYWFFMLQAMELAGKNSEAFRNIEKNWSPMLDTGTPTLWEAAVHVPGKSSFGGTGSVCHGFSSAPVDFMQRKILGVEPLEPGFVRFSVDPWCGSLNFAQGRIPTPAGAIRICWKRKNNQLEVELHVPAETTAVTPAGEFPAGNHTFVIPVK